MSFRRKVPAILRILDRMRGVYLFEERYVFDPSCEDMYFFRWRQVRVP
jgi:hypothetical protein